MGMRHVNPRQRLHLGQVQRESFQRALELLFRALGNFAPGLLAAHMQVALVAMLAPPAMNLDGNLACQLAAKVLHVHSGPAIDVRRVFPREESYSHFSASCRAPAQPPYLVQKGRLTVVWRG